MSQKKILLIEDDELLRESTAVFLEEEGFSVFIAKNGLQGVEKALEHIPDIILCDISMPRMNGYEVYKVLNENSTTNLIPFIFLSAKTEKEDIRVGMQMGADDYITKPFDYDELLRAIELRIKKREKLKAASESSFKTLLDSTLTGVFIYQGNQITFANSKLLKIFGYAADEVKTLDLYDIAHPDDRPAISEKIRRCINGIQSSFNINFRAISKSNETIYLDCWGGLSVINGQNAIVGNIINLSEYRNSQTPPANVESMVANEHISDISPANNPDNLTRREIEVLQQICLGLTNQEIADKLFVSVRTVDTHRGNLLSKTGVANTAGLVVYAIKNNLFSVDKK